MSRRPRPLGLKIEVPDKPPLIVPPRNLDSRATITIDEHQFEVQADDLEKIADLGRGAYGIVEKMRHIKTGTIMAVKKITATVNTQEQVREFDDFFSIFFIRTSLIAFLLFYCRSDC